MPRNITVTFDDGSTHVYNNAPDDVTPDAVASRAYNEFGKNVTSLDGGRKASNAAPKVAPKAPPTQPIAKMALDSGSEELERQIAKLPEKFKRMARDKYFADSRITRLREASARPISQAKKEGARASQRAERREGMSRNISNALRFNPVTAPVVNLMDEDQLAAAGGGFARSLFGLPERIGAGVEYFLNNPENKSYGNLFQELQEDIDLERDRSVSGNILGSLAGGAAGGGAAGSLIRAGGAKLAASGAPAVVQTAGRAAQSLATPSASKIANVGKLALAGAAGGGAQAIGEGSDISTGVTVGAIAAPVVTGLAKSASWMLRPARDVIARLPRGGTQADEFLRRFTKAKSEDLQRAADEYRAATGSEPTLYEILPLEDRNRIAKDIVGRAPAVAERAADKVRQRFANVGPEMVNRVDAATGPGRTGIAGNMAAQMDDARGAVDQGALPGMDTATRGPLPMKDFQQDVDRAIMEPVRGQEVADDVDALIPRTPELQPNGEVHEVVSDPEVAAAIRNAAGSLRLRRSAGDESADLSGLTANDAATILRNLSRKTPGQDGYGAAQRAIPHIFDLMEARSPQASAQIARMREAHAANARRLEGLQEGGMGRTRETAPITQLQAVRNAYDTPEGTEGRFLGQANRTRQELSGTPLDSARTAEELASSGNTQAALRGNLGQGPADNIIAAADAQARSIRALGSLDKEKGAVADSLSAEDVGRMILAANPASMPTTKLFALSRLHTLAGIPTNKAQQIVDLVFSQDPNITNRAIKVLNSKIRNGDKFLAEIGSAMASGALASQVADAGGEAIDAGLIPEAAAAETMVDPETGELMGVVSDVVEEPELEPEDTEAPYGRAVIEALFPGVHVTDDQRDPNSDLGQANPGSWHVRSDGAVDVRPIPGMTFEEFVQTIRDEGYEIVEAIDEVKNPSGHATGPHWHVVLK